MNFYTRRFNLYLLPWLVCLLVSGCALWHHSDKNKAVGIVRVHVESDNSNAGSTKDITFPRSEPIKFNIQTDAILTEADIVGARLFDTPGGGFAVELKFAETAGWRLQQYTAASPGKHLAIFAQWGKALTEGRWVAAPLIAHPIANGTLTFTPDASRQELEQWIKGLDAEAKKNTTTRETP